MVNEQWTGDEAERVLAEECRDWCKAVRGPLSDTQLAHALKVRRGTLSEVITDGVWSSARSSVRQMWCAQRVWRLQMSVEDVQAEYAEYVAEEARKKAAALGVSSEAEVHEDNDDTPYATAVDEGLQAISGVSHENIETGSTPLAGKPREIEQGGEPDEDEDASQPGAVLSDAEVPDDATQAIVPADAPDVTAVMPVAPAETRLTPASVQSPVNAPVTFDDPPAALGDASAGAPVAGAPTGESEAGVPARGAYNENALAEGDAAATDDADAADWGENAAVCVTEGASEEVRLSLTGGPPPVGLDFEDMIALIGARNAERCGQEAFSIELHCKVSDTAAPRSPSGAMSV